MDELNKSASPLLDDCSHGPVTTGHVSSSSAIPRPIHPQAILLTHFPITNVSQSSSLPVQSDQDDQEAIPFIPVVIHSENSVSYSSMAGARSANSTPIPTEESGVDSHDLADAITQQPQHPEEKTR